jgi:hypothetical protein
VGCGPPGRRRRGRGPGRDIPRRPASGPAAARGRVRGGRGVHRAATDRLHGRPRLRRIRPDGRARRQSLRGDPLPAAPHGGSGRHGRPPRVAQARGRVRAPGHRRAVGRGQAWWHLGGADRLLAEALDRAGVRRGGARPGQAAALRSCAAGPGAPALVGEPAAALGAGRRWARRRAGRRRWLPRAHRDARTRASRAARRTARARGRAAGRGGGRHKDQLSAVRRGTGLGGPPLPGRVARRRGRCRVRAPAHVRVVRCPGRQGIAATRQRGVGGQLLPDVRGIPRQDVPAPAAAGRGALGRRGAAAAVAPAGRGPRPARDQAGPGGRPRLAVHLALPAAVV